MEKLWNFEGPFSGVEKALGKGAKLVCVWEECGIFESCYFFHMYLKLSKKPVTEIVTENVSF